MICFTIESAANMQYMLHKYTQWVISNGSVVMIPMGHCAKTLNVLFWILKAMILNKYYYPYCETNTFWNVIWLPKAFQLVNTRADIWMKVSLFQKPVLYRLPWDFIFFLCVCEILPSPDHWYWPYWKDGYLTGFTKSERGKRPKHCHYTEQILYPNSGNKNKM